MNSTHLHIVTMNSRTDTYIKDPSLNALYLRRNDLWRNMPRCNLAASTEAKRAYRIAADRWLEAVHEVDGKIAAAKKAGAA